MLYILYYIEESRKNIAEVQEIVSGFSSSIYEMLCYRVRPYLPRQETNLLKTIIASERLCLTLKFLAFGDTQSSKARGYRVSSAVVSRRINET